jgi:hypothetical protein
MEGADVSDETGAGAVSYGPFLGMLDGALLGALLAALYGALVGAAYGAHYGPGAGAASGALVAAANGVLIGACAGGVSRYAMTYLQKHRAGNARKRWLPPALGALGGAMGGALVGWMLRRRGGLLLGALASLYVAAGWGGAVGAVLAARRSTLWGTSGPMRAVLIGAASGPLVGMLLGSLLMEEPLGGAFLGTLLGLGLGPLLGAALGLWQRWRHTARR